MIGELGFGVHLHHDRPRDPEAAPTHAAWTAPRTWVTSELVTSSIMNTHVRDNLVALSIGARAYHSANQAITTATLTVLALNSDRYDSDTIHDLVTNNSRLTCKTAGRYAIKANVAFAANTVGVRELDILRNGATVIGATVVDANANSGGAIATIIAAACDYTLAVNDYVEMRVYQDSGGNLNVLASGNYSPEFSMHFIGA